MPLLFNYTEPRWGVWKTDESTEDLLSLLSGKEDYSSLLSVMRTENRKKEWLAVRVLAKELLGEEVRIDYHPNGAPYLPDQNLQISISHTNGYVAVLFSTGRSAGIDIEYMSDRIVRVRDRFLSEEENNHIDKTYTKEHLLIHWCAKETLFKMMQQEDVDFANHLHISPFPFQKEGRLTASETRTPQAALYEINYRVYNDFVVTFGLL